MGVLLVDMLFPSRFAKWRIEETRTLIREMDADVLVFKLDAFAGIDLSIDYEAMFDEFDLWKFNILIFDQRFNFLDKYNRGFDGTCFNGRFQASYLFTRHRDFDVRRYERIHHLFLINFVRFHRLFDVPTHRQSVHLYPGGGLANRDSLLGIPRDLKLISTQRFVTDWLLDLGFVNHIEVLGGVMAQAGSECKPKGPRKGPLTVCFSSMGHAREKGADLYLEIATRYAARYPSDLVRFVAVGNFPPCASIKTHSHMSQTELDRFYAEEVDVLLSLDSGLAYNGWPLGAEALMQGVVLFTTDVHGSNRHHGYDEGMMFICGSDPGEYVDGIRLLYEDPALLARISRGGQARAHELYGYAAQQGRIIPFVLR